MIHGEPFGKSIALLLILIGCGVLATPVHANVRFFTLVMQNCQHYRVSANMVQMNLEDSGTGELIFYFTLPSRRNNFEEVILVGYLAASHAVARTGLNVKTIYVTAAISKAENMVMTSMAEIALAKKLRLGQIKPYEFMRKIEWIGKED